MKAELNENDNVEKAEKPKKQQNYEKSSVEILEVKNQKKVSNPSLEDVSG